MKNIIYLFTYLFILNLCSQNEKETIYLLFDNSNNKKCVLEDGNGNFIKTNFYRKEIKERTIRFRICDEHFGLDRKSEIDTCNLNYLSKIKFETIKSIRKKREKLKDEHFFLNSVFKKFYIVEKYKDKIIKYPVVWGTDMIEN